MSTARSDSSMKMGSRPGAAQRRAGGNDSATADGNIRLESGVPVCSCPDCSGPMSIRLWLMAADCFRCGRSLQLSPPQEQEALRLVREQEEAKRAASREAVAAISPTMLRKPLPAVPVKPPPLPAMWPWQRPRVAAAEVHRGARAHVRDLYEKGRIAVFFAGLLNDLPAWVVSFVVHLIALLLLGLWYDVPVDEAEAITLATSISDEDLQGQQREIDRSLADAFEFEEPGAVELPGKWEEAGTPSEEAVDFEPGLAADPVGDLPDTAQRTSLLLPPPAPGSMFAGRDPTARARAVQQGGGTSATEAAVARGLVFLARHQNSDGSWSLHQFHQSPNCDKTCTQPGNTHSDTAATALGLLPFLGAGQTHEEGKYTQEVFAGLNWLLEHQKQDGDLHQGGHPKTQMYAHAQATIALCEAYALTGDEQLREPAQRALNFIIHAQHPQGGWRYAPQTPGDTSVIGWQLMALKSGQLAYLLVPAKTYELAGHYLDRAQTDPLGGRYAYVPGQQPTNVMTAEALLCRQYLGWPKDHAGLQSGVDFLLKEHLPETEKPHVYYWYYATQVMHHVGGRPWQTWNAKMRDVLLDKQKKRGHAAGSWTPEGGHSAAGGRIYMTSLAICTLEVYYRHMPLYGQDAVTDQKTGQVRY